MPVSNIHINPVAPDQNTSGRYGSPEERAQRDAHAHEEPQEAPSDRLEISTGARESYRLNAFGPDMDFARKALDKSPSLPENRLSQIIYRIESGYYQLPGVFWSVVTHMIPTLRQS